MGKIDIVLGNDIEGLYLDGKLKIQARRLTVMDLAQEGNIPVDFWEGFLAYSEKDTMPPTLKEAEGKIMQLMGEE